MDRIMIDVFLTGKRKISVVVVRRRSGPPRQSSKCYQVSPASVKRLAALARHDASAKRGRVVPFFNGWSWTTWLRRAL